MKKVFIILAAVVVLVFIALGIFISTFNIDHYRAMITQKIEKAIGSPVAIQKLSLTWKNGLALALDNLSVYSGSKLSGEKVMSLDKAYVGLEFKPLLKKEIKLSSILLLKPSFEIVRTEDGSIQVPGFKIPKSIPGPETLNDSQALSGIMQNSNVAVKTPKNPRVLASLAFLVDEFKVEGASVKYQDLAIEPSLDIALEQIDILIKNISLNNPFEFSSKMALFSPRQNINLKGIVGGIAEAKPFLKDFNAQLDLGAVEYAKLLQALPMLKSSGIKDGLAGEFSLEIEEAAVDMSGNLAKLNGKVTLKDGQVSLAQIKKPLEKINLAADIDYSQIRINDFNAELAGASIKGSGTVDAYLFNPKSTLKASINTDDLNTFLSAFAAQQKQVDGKLDVSFSAAGSGKDWPQISQNLSGRGNLKLTDAVLRDTNILKEALDKLSLFPGLAQKLRESLPEDYKKKLQAKDTPIKPIDASFLIQNGIIGIDNLKLATDMVEIDAKADVSLSGEMSGQGVIRFDKVLSKSMEDSFEQLKYLKNSEELVEFPAQFSLKSGKFSLKPDLQYISQKMLMGEGQSRLSDIFKKSGQDQEAQEGQTQQEDSGSSGGSIEDIFKSIFSPKPEGAEGQ